MLSLHKDAIAFCFFEFLLLLIKLKIVLQPYTFETSEKKQTACMDKESGFPERGTFWYYFFLSFDDSLS